jgi:hypothetical protein
MKESFHLILNVLYNTCPVTQQNEGCNKGLPIVYDMKRKLCVT